MQPRETQKFELTEAQQQYVAYTAVGGLLPSDDGLGVKMKVEEFAEKVGVSRATLWRWREQIPNFWDRVGEARRTIGGKDRLTNVWNSVYLKAVGGNWMAQKMYLANHDPNYREPAQKLEVEAGNSWAALLNKKQDQLENGAVIEAEVISQDE